MVKKFVDENPGTILISTSDHETGGFTLARQVSSAYPEYLWYPDVISRVKNSTIVLADAIHSLKGASKVEEQRVVVERVVTEGLGITDATDDEMKFLLSNPSRSALDHFLADMISIRAQLGVSPTFFFHIPKAILVVYKFLSSANIHLLQWTTHGHSGVDVNLYAYGVDADLLRGSHENTNIGSFIEHFLNLDLNEITERLNK